MPEARTHFSWGWLGAVGAAALVVVLATLPPLVGIEARLMLMTAFSGVCHQIAERSPQVAGVPLAVCHRCYGIYLGVLAGALLFPLLRRPLAGRHTGRLLLAAALPAAVDWGGDVAGLWMNTPATRVATGALFGVVAGCCLARALAQASRRTPEARQAPSEASEASEASSPKEAGAFSA